MAEVIIHRQGVAGRITLNRPQALHALNEEMCLAMDAALKAWADDDEVELVVVDHAEGTRGFCAGGDIRMLAESGLGDGSAAQAFFRAEYRLNTRIKNYPKPYVAFMDGVTMGGGVGISVHGSHRVATERTTFAMPARACSSGGADATAACVVAAMSAITESKTAPTKWSLSVKLS